MIKAACKLLYRLSLCAECAYGLYLNIFAQMAGFMSSNVLRYFTIQSNILVLIVALFSAAASVREFITGCAPRGAFYRGIRLACATAITLTFGVFWIMLTGSNSGIVLKSLGNLTVHAITPILFVFDFLMFDRTENMKIQEILLSVIAPAAYFVFSLIYAKAANPMPLYPYWFMDPTQIGWFGIDGQLGVAQWCAILIAFMILLALLYRKVYNRNRKA